MKTNDNEFVQWPILGAVGPIIRYLLLGYVFTFLTINIGLLLWLVKVAAPHSITASGTAFIVWLAALMTSQCIGTAVSVVINQQMFRMLYNRLNPEPMKVILETRPGELKDCR